MCLEVRCNGGKASGKVQKVDVNQVFHISKYTFLVHFRKDQKFCF